MRKFWRSVGQYPAVIRIIILLFGVLVIAAPFAIPLYKLEYSYTGGRSIIFAPLSLFLVWLLCLPLWLKHVHQLKYPWLTLGMAGGRKWLQNWAIAFLFGAVGVIVLYSIQLSLGWGSWVAPSPHKLAYHLLEGGLVGVGVGLMEELVFRGWLLFELEKDFAPTVALGLNAAFFAIAHYFRPISAILESWPQFLGLLLLGVTLVWARRIPILAKRIDCPVITLLGFPAGLHGGLVWAYYQVDVNDVIQPTHRIPAWVTGIGGNPLAGVLGLLLLGAIAAVMYRASHSQISHRRSNF